AAPFPAGGSARFPSGLDPPAESGLRAGRVRRRAADEVPLRCHDARRGADLQVLGALDAFGDQAEREVAGEAPERLQDRAPTGATTRSRGLTLMKSRLFGGRRPADSTTHSHESFSKGRSTRSARAAGNISAEGWLAESAPARRSPSNPIASPVARSAIGWNF